MQSVAEAAGVDLGITPVTVESDSVCLHSLVTVVIEAVVAAQCSQGTQSDGIGEENLGASINPHLPQREKHLLNL